MFRIAICDDDEIFLGSFHRDMDKVLDSLYVSSETSEFHKTVNLYHELDEGIRYDVIFLDIEFANDKKNGIFLGNYIRDELHIESTQLIYISSRQSYAMELFHSRPFDFLTKPIDISKLTEDLRKIIEIDKVRKYTFSFNSGGDTIQLELSNILYLQSDNHKIHIHCQDGTTYTYTGRLQKVYSNLKNKNFFAPHKSYLVNYYAVKHWSRHELVMTDDTIIPISRSHVDEVSAIQLRNH